MSIVQNLTRVATKASSTIDALQSAQKIVIAALPVLTFFLPAAANRLHHQLDDIASGMATARVARSCILPCKK